MAPVAAEEDGLCATDELEPQAEASEPDGSERAAVAARRSARASAAGARDQASCAATPRDGRRRVPIGRGAWPAAARTCAATRAWARRRGGGHGAERCGVP